MHAANRALLASCAASLAASVAAAQSPALGSPVSASGSFMGDSQLDRAALYTQSAFVAPKGRFGFNVQAIGSSATIEEGLEKFEVRQGGAAFSAFYGLTSAVTLGAGLPFRSVTTEFSGTIVDGESTDDGFDDIELFGRLRAFRSTSGATKLALGAGMSLPTGDEAFTNDDPTYNFSGAMSHRANLVSFHVAPDVRLVKDYDPSFDVNVAAVFAASPRLSLSVEGLSTFEGGPKGFDGERGRATDIGAGLRYSAAANLALDLGLRANVSNNLEGVDTRAGGLTFGFNWLFYAGANPVRRAHRPAEPETQ